MEEIAQNKTFYILLAGSKLCLSSLVLALIIPANYSCRIKLA